jgi:uncharacterized protein YdhG (YjbR/CyaY superfamily)
MSQRSEVLLVTKGHPFDRAAFFGLFDGLPDVGWTHVEHPAAEALFAPDEARRFDAFVCYDMPGIRFHPNRAPDFPDPDPRLKARLQTAPSVPAPSADLQALLKQLLPAAMPAKSRLIQASLGREVKMIAPEDVIFFESDNRYTRVVYEGGEALIRTPLKELLAQLDAEQFWQVHRSVLVNSRHIATAVRVDENTMQLTLKGRDEKLPVSRQFQGLFKGQ